MKLYRALMSIIFSCIVSFSIFCMEETEITWQEENIGFDDEAKLQALFNTLENNDYEKLTKENLGLTGDQNTAVNSKNNTFPMELLSRYRYELQYGNALNQVNSADAFLKCFTSNYLLLDRCRLNSCNESLDSLLSSVKDMKPHKDSYKLDIQKITPAEPKIILTLDEYAELKKNIQDRVKEEGVSKPYSQEVIKAPKRSASSRKNISQMFKNDYSPLDFRKKPDRPPLEKRRSLSDGNLPKTSQKEILSGLDKKPEWVITDHDLITWVTKTQEHTEDILKKFASIWKYLEKEKLEKYNEECAKRLEKATE